MDIEKNALASSLDELESTARELDPGDDERRRAAATVSTYIQKYIEDLPDAPAFYDRSDMGAGILDLPITDEGIGLESALSQLSEHVDKVGINTTSGRFLGYIPGGGLYYSGLGDWLAAAANKYSGIFFASPGAVRIENLLLRWMADLIGYPDSAAGYLSAGGSMANLTAVVTARETFGLEGAAIQEAVVYLTDHAHHSITKALHLAGLARCEHRLIPVDEKHRMRADALREAIAQDEDGGRNPFLIVASAGTTNTGSIDPLDAIADIAEQANIWYHVDAAYGGFFILCPEVNEALKGMSRADSVVMDPHKTLFLPYGTGALLVKDGTLLEKAHVAGADYMQDAYGEHAEASPANLSPELTKHFRGLRLWLPLQVHGVAPFRAALSEKIQLARYFHARLKEVEGFEVGPVPDLSVVTYRYLPKSGDPDDFNQKLIEALRADGQIFISSTRIRGAFMLRMAAVVFRTHRSDIDTALEVLEATARRLDC